MPSMPSLPRLSKLSAALSLSKIVFYAVLLLAILAGYGWLKAYLVGPDLAVTTLYKVKTVPTVVKETKESVRIKEVRVEVPVYIKVPTEKEKERIEEKYQGSGVDLDVETLLGEWFGPKSPWGSSILVTKGADDHVKVTVLPKERPFFQLGGARGIGAGVGQSNLGISWRLFYEQDIVRVGPVWINGEASFGDLGNGQSHWRVEAKAIVRF